MPNIVYLPNDSDDFLFGISLAELIILLFFILLLLFLRVLQVHTKEDLERSQMLESCGAELRESEGLLNALQFRAANGEMSCESELIIMTRNTAALESSIKQQQTKIKALEDKELLLMEKTKKVSQFEGLADNLDLTGEQIEELGKLLEKIRLEDKSVLGSLQEMVAKVNAQNLEIESLKDTLGAIEETADPKEALSASIDELLSKNKELTDENLDCVARIESQKKRCGLDYPACWEREPGRVEYMFNVTVVNAGFQIRKAYFDGREEDAAGIPGVSEMLGKDVGVRTFARFGNSILKWSMDRNCRHYVRVFDTDETTKETYKKRLKLVENYFYKFEPQR